MNILYGTLLVIGINAAILIAIFKGVQWLDKWQESKKKHGKATN